MKLLDTIAKYFKAEYVLFTGYDHAHGVFILKNGESYTFTINEAPLMDLTSYYLPYIQGKDEKFGINLSYAKYWIIPLTGTYVICNQKKLLKSIFENDWDTKVSNGIKYFIIPKDWLVANCFIIKE